MKYRVWLRGMTKFVEVEAADVNLESEGEAVFWNLIATSADDEASNVTVAAFPYDAVEYIVRE